MSVNFRQYPPFWVHDVTVYNRYKSEDGSLSWYSTQLSDCFMARTKATQMMGDEKQDVDVAICRIPETELYRSPDIWVQLGESGRASFFTLQPEDIIVRGHVSDVIDESTKGQRSSDLLERYSLSGAFRVGSSADNTGPFLGSPHYRATEVY